MKDLNFGTFSGVSNVTISAEIKTHMALPNGKGLCVLEEVVGSEATDSTSGQVSNKIQLRFKGVEGGGCTDTITTKSASMWKLGITRIKYLLSAMGISLPASCEKPTIHPNVNDTNSEIFKVAHSALIAYETATGRDIDSTLVQKDSNGNILLTARSAFAEIFDGTGLLPLYSDLDGVGRERIAHNKVIKSLKGNAEELEKETARYNAYLDAQPVLPCLVNDQAYTDLLNALTSIENDSSVFIKARDWNTKVRSYEVAK